MDGLDGPGTYEVSPYQFVVDGQTINATKVTYFNHRDEEYTAEEFYGHDRVMPNFTEKQ